MPNPFLATQDFGDAWKTEEQYTNFREKIHTYREWIDDAYNEQDRSESIAKWRREIMLRVCVVRAKEARGGRTRSIRSD